MARSVAGWPLARPEPAGYPVNIKMFGATGDGVTDDTAAFQQAVRECSAVFVPAGRYRLTSTVELFGPVSIIGEGSLGVVEESAAPPDFSRNPVTLLCAGITGATFRFNFRGLTSPSQGYHFEGLFLNGLITPGGTSAYTNWSTTWTGMFAHEDINGATKMIFHLMVKNCRVSFSAVAGAAAFYLITGNTVRLENCMGSHFGYGYGCYIGSGGTNFARGALIDSCYFRYNRDAFRASSNSSIYKCVNTVFEASVIGCVLNGGNGVFDSCGWEWINYDVTSTGILTGQMNKNFGLSLGAELNVPMTSAINLRSCEVLFKNCEFAYRDPSGTTAATHPEAAWLFMNGLDGAFDSGGASARFEGCKFNTLPSLSAGGAQRFLEINANAGQNFLAARGCSLTWHSNWYRTRNGDPRESLDVADARLLRDGSMFMTAPTTAGQPKDHQYVEIEHGKFVMRGPSADVPTRALSGGDWEVGDRYEYTNPAAGGKIGSVCVTAGSPGTWKSYGVIDA